MTDAPSGLGLAAVAAEAFARHLEGEGRAMDALVDAVTPLLWHTARSQGASASNSEDIVQTTWLKLIEHAGEIADPQAVLQWLLVTTKRESWAVSRRARSTMTSEFREESIAVARNAERPSGPAEQATLSEEQRTLWRHLGELEPRCQELLRLIAFVDRPDYDVVSSALGMPIGSIGPTRGRCLSKLRRLLLADPSWEVLT